MSRRALAIAAWTLAAAAWLAPLASGYFLSDDFVIFAMFGEAEARGRLLAEAFAKFIAGLDVATSRFYRPLPHLTFVACYALFGANATPWLLVNLCAHLAAAVLVAVLAWQLAADRSGRALAAGLAGATVFLAFAPGLEATAWVAARYDTFSTLFALTACVAFVASARRWDRAEVLSLVAFVLAFLSKESAAIVPPAILVLALWRARGESMPLPRRLLRALVAASPWLALGVAYLLLRAAIFGSAVEVYAGTRPMAFALSPERWSTLAASVAPFVRAQLPEPAWRGAFVALFAALPLVAAWVAAFDRPLRPGVLAALALVAGSLLLLAPHLPVLEADGSSGRLFHMTGAFLGVLAGVVGSSAAFRGAPLVFALLIAAATLVTGTASRQHWERSHEAMRQVAQALGTLHASLGPRDHALVILPRGDGPAAFGLNAQAGLMLPPVQARSIADRVLVQTADELAGTAAGYAHGLIANLRSLPLLEVAKKRFDGPAEFPTQVYCWANSRPILTPVPVEGAPDAQAWLRSLRAGLAARGCRQ